MSDAAAGPDKIEVDAVVRMANLARIGLAPGEAVAFADQFRSILDYFQMLAVADIPPGTDTRGLFGSEHLLREDVVAPSLPREKALALAPKRSGDFVQVPTVLPQDGGTWGREHPEA